MLRWRGVPIIGITMMSSHQLSQLYAQKLPDSLIDWNDMNGLPKYAWRTQDGDWRACHPGSSQKLSGITLWETNLSNTSLPMIDLDTLGPSFIINSWINEDVSALTHESW
jgi:hypothetical protein